MKEQRKRLDRDRIAWETEKAAINQRAKVASNRVLLNIGGKYRELTRRYFTEFPGTRWYTYFSGMLDVECLNWSKY